MTRDTIPLRAVEGFHDDFIENFAEFGWSSLRRQVDDVPVQQLDQERSNLAIVADHSFDTNPSGSERFAATFEYTC